VQNVSKKGGGKPVYSIGGKRGWRPIISRNERIKELLQKRRDELAKGKLN